MASNITSETIDSEYPVAGQDNDSQGFRDNFNIIKSNFASAKAEIEDLQNNVLLKNTLTGQDDLENDLLGKSIIQAKLQRHTLEYYATGVLANSMNISFLNGHYQDIGIREDGLILQLTDWPGTGAYAKMTLELVASGAGTVDNPTDGPFEVTFVIAAGGQLKQSASWPGTEAGKITLDSATEPTIIEFWTTDGGATVYGNYLGKFS